jgi:hypothetical protein
MTFWFILLGAPLLAYGLIALLKPDTAARLLLKFPRSKTAGIILAVAAWFFTAYELHTIGIEVFDRFLKIFPGELWILAGVLSFLTCIWMENLLPLRALAALFMLFPAEMFPVIRLAQTPWRLTLVVFAYVCIIVGMFGMFYPWRIRQALAWLADKPVRVAAIGATTLALGSLCIVLGVLI